MTPSTGVSEESARSGGERNDDGDGRRGRLDADEGGFGLGTSPADEQVRVLEIIMYLGDYKEIIMALDLARPLLMNRSVSSHVLSRSCELLSEPQRVCIYTYMCVCVCVLFT
jgi:hypothetical protein